MTRTLCTRSSKRKTAKTSQEVVSDDYKENSPSILSQPTIKKLSETKINNSKATKENVSPRIVSGNFIKELYSPVRKSVRRPKTNVCHQTKPLPTKRNVLCDKTNSPGVTAKLNEQSLTKTDSKNNILHKSVPKANLNNLSLYSSLNSVNHVPVYKTVESLEVTPENENVPSEKKETVYEFEVDENEEPVQKKKRKKRVYVRRPKIGPKALTINNIKYSSSESLASLPKKPTSRKKQMTKVVKSNLKPFSSVTDLHETENSCYSVKSFMSHPPSLLLCENKMPTSKHELSVLQETQSELCERSFNEVQVEADVHYPQAYSPSAFNPVTNQAVSTVCNPSTLSDTHFSPNPRCYLSKSRRDSAHSSNSPHNMPNNSFCHQASSCSANTSAISTHFLSSTPCKRVSHVVSRNSVFDDSGDLPRGLRPSTGFTKDASQASSTLTDNCFGFDEPEELEEPLVSPIKCGIDLAPRKPVRFIPRNWETDKMEQPKPSAQEVIEMLKATIAKATNAKDTSEVNDSSIEDNKPSSSTKKNKIPITFKKPPRRSYERQRRVRYNSDYEEEEEVKSEEEIVEENCHNEEKVPMRQPQEKCYKKINKSRSAKPAKVTKAKQKIAKEEEEFERLAAQMNAQFEAIENTSLIIK